MGSAPHRDRCVLVIEDDRDIRDTIAEVLEEEGYVGLTAKHGADALTCLRNAAQLPTLIVLDLMMPVMDGIAFRDEQRKVPEWADIPVVVLSADRSSRDKAEAMGASGYLQKPFNIDQLLELLGKIEGAGPGAPVSER